MGTIKRAIFWGAKKGGVGKSFACRAFVDAARAAGRSVALFDLDGQTGSLALLYPIGDPIAGVATEDVRDPKAPAAWLDALHGDADDVVLDIPGGALGDLLRTFDAGTDALLTEVRGSGREFVFVSVVGTKKDSTATAQEAAELFGSSVRHVVVKNGFFGAPDDFLIFDGDGTRFGKTAKMIASVNGRVVYLPRLSAAADALCDMENMTFTQAAAATERIGRRHATNVRYWLHAVVTAFADTWLDIAGRVATNNEARVGAA